MLENESVLVFLQGAEMQPSRVRAAWPAARFVARARLTARPQGPVFAPAAPAYEAWGIVVETGAAAAETSEARAVTTDDGVTLAVQVPPPDAADARSVLAAAKYWELPPPYVRRLAYAASVPVEEYFY